jgi:hypothetical protein
MQTIRTLALAALVGIILYASIWPGIGLVYHSPLAAFGLGLIGLGVCKEVRKRRLA